MRRGVKSMQRARSRALHRETTGQSEFPFSLSVLPPAPSLPAAYFNRRA